MSLQPQITQAAERILAGLLVRPEDLRDAIRLHLGIDAIAAALPDEWQRVAAGILLNGSVPTVEGAVDLGALSGAMRDAGVDRPETRILSDLAALIDQAPLPVEVERDWIPRLIDLIDRRAISAAARTLAAGAEQGEPDRAAVRQLLAVTGKVQPLRASDVTPRLPEWLWTGRVPRGTLTLLTGLPGLGKTTLLLDLAARLSRGRGWPFDCATGLPETGATLYVSAEDDHDTLTLRLRAADADMDRVYLWPQSAPLPSFPDGLDELADIVARFRISMVLLDPLPAMLGPRLDSHRDADVRRALAPLMALAGAQRLAIVGVVHLNKSGAAQGQTALARVSGAGAWVAAARSVLLTAPPPCNGSSEVNEDEIVIASAKSNLGRRPPALRARRVDLGATLRLDWLGECEARADELVSQPREPRGDRKIDAAELLLETALEAGPVKVEEIKDRAGAQGLNWRTVQRAASKLGIRNDRSTGELRWSLP